MRLVQPEVYCIGRPNVDVGEMQRYLESVGGESWLDRIEPLYELHDDEGRHGEALVEFAGRLCYRSWEPGLNPNVTKVREDSEAYFANMLGQGHGSPTELGFYVFVFHNVTRVFTHELVRHRAGTAFAQESLRFVRLTDIPFWMPQWAQEDDELMDRSMEVLTVLEDHQRWMAEHFDLDATITVPCDVCDGGRTIGIGEPGGCGTCEGKRTIEVPAVPFGEKKAKTSFMRRFAPIGLATSIVFGVNIRAARHTITMRAAESAEEEIDLVFRKVYEIIGAKAPFLFGDFTVTEKGVLPGYAKV